MRIILNLKEREKNNLLTLAQGVVGKNYQIAGFHPSLMQDHHLRNLGLTMGSSIRLIAPQVDGGIVTMGPTKIALNQEILEKILITEITEEKPRYALATLKPNQKGNIAAVLGTGAVKRRLLDMGLTRGTEILLRKVAPMGDPIEIKIRGYELTLRKQEVELIMVTLEDDR
ncbi:FeoA family protein [Enterococcus timonensis]|uniref:FeoA family protein n=1 Tax=Enterococcus timonensis TaxID=1852364 RepID=UPI001F30495E|nr:ferrous iron transport protein A [Enterococcus timonensis]